MKRFLEQAQKDNDFTHIAFISDKGIAYAADGAVPAMSKISGLDKLLGDSGKLMLCQRKHLGKQHDPAGYHYDSHTVWRQSISGHYHWTAYFRYWIEAGDGQ